MFELLKYKNLNLKSVVKMTYAPGHCVLSGLFLCHLVNQQQRKNNSLAIMYYDMIVTASVFYDIYRLSKCIVMSCKCASVIRLYLVALTCSFLVETQLLSILEKHLINNLEFSLC